MTCTALSVNFLETAPSCCARCVGAATRDRAERSAPVGDRSRSRPLAVRTSTESYGERERAAWRARSGAACSERAGVLWRKEEQQQARSRQAQRTTARTWCASLVTLCNGQRAKSCALRRRRGGSRRSRWARDTPAMRFPEHCRPGPGSTGSYKLAHRCNLIDTVRSGGKTGLWSGCQHMPGSYAWWPWAVLVVALESVRSQRPGWCCCQVRTGRGGTTPMRNGPGLNDRAPVFFHMSSRLWQDAMQGMHRAPPCPPHPPPLVHTQGSERLPVRAPPYHSNSLMGPRSTQAANAAVDHRSFLNSRHGRGRLAPASLRYNHRRGCCWRSSEAGVHLSCRRHVVLLGRQARWPLSPHTSTLPPPPMVATQSSTPQQSGL